MTSMIIIVAAVALAVAFSLAWLFWPGLRDDVERPKHRFQDQVNRYDRRVRDAAGSGPRPQ
jgi:hypothetical protein